MECDDFFGDILLIENELVLQTKVLMLACTWETVIKCKRKHECDDWGNNEPPYFIENRMDAAEKLVFFKLKIVSVF